MPVHDLNQVQGADQVVVVVLQRLLHGLAHGLQTGEVDDRVDPGGASENLCPRQAPSFGRHPCYPVGLILGNQPVATEDSAASGLSLSRRLGRLGGELYRRVQPSIVIALDSEVTFR